MPQARSERNGRRAEIIVQPKQELTMPILLWLLGMPLSLILILMLLGGL